MDWPPPPEPPEDVWTRVARLDQLVDGRPRIVRVGVKQLLVVRLGDRIVATNNRCPHAGGSLGHGRIAGHLVVCPRHEWAFDLVTGVCPDHDIYHLTTYQVDVRGDHVFVAVPTTLEASW